MSEYVLEMLNIVKTFPGVRALDGVALKVRSGSVHALMGENGAGKSTLMKCLIGIYHKNGGSILLHGNEVDFSSTHESLRAGISMIQQEMSPVMQRSVKENVWLGREPKRGLLIDNKKMHDDTTELFERLGIEKIDPNEFMVNLSVAQMQLVEIAKAVSFDASIVIMDEPTSSLTDREANILFSIIDDLKKDGVAIIYISHKMDEIFRICDEVTVMRDGTLVGSDLSCNLDNDKLISMMVGREMKNIFPKRKTHIGDTILKIEKLSSGKTFRDISFELHAGEILGFAGLVGAGRTELMESIFGVRRISSGKIYKNGQELHIRSSEDAIANGFALLCEDRRKDGIVGMLSVMDNAVLANLKAYGMPLNAKKIKQDSELYAERLKIKTPNLWERIQNLSGGNQQKVLVARWLLTDPDILIMDEPTRGIDVGAKSEIHELISDLAAAGKSIILISSEMSEVLSMSDRIIVMHEGEMTGILDRQEATQERILKYASGDIN